MGGFSFLFKFIFLFGNTVTAWIGSRTAFCSAIALCAWSGVVGRGSGSLMGMVGVSARSRESQLEEHSGIP